MLNLLRPPVGLDFGLSALAITDGLHRPGGAMDELVMEGISLTPIILPESREQWSLQTP
ncbi:MAG: hypothetical protein P8Y85_02475 [Nitrospirota bacterium]